MTRRMMRQPWVIFCLLAFTTVFIASVYDTRRESTAERQLHQAGISLSVEELKATCSPEPWQTNGLRFYRLATAKYRYPDNVHWEHLVIVGDLEHEYGHEFTNEQRDALHAFVAANAEAIAFILKAQECPFTRLPGKRYDTDDMSHLGRTRDLARLVACAALDAALSGDTATMGEMISAGLRLHEIVGEGGLLIDALVAKSLCTIAFDALEDCLYYTRPPSEVIHSWLNVLDMEIYNTYPWLGEILKNETTSQYQMFEIDGPYFKWPRNLYWQRTLLKLALEETQFFYFVQNGYILGMKSIIDMTRKDPYDWSASPEAILLEEQWDTNARNIFIYFGILSYIRALTLCANNISQAAAARATLASLLYLEDYEKMPDTLDVLTPDYLPTPAGDPFTQDELLRYRVSNSQAVFYSVGPNEKDDGGTETGHGESILDKGDIIFRVPLEATNNGS